jgi:hypothetical protein
MFPAILASLIVILAGLRRLRRAAGADPGWCPAAGSASSGAGPGTVEGKDPRQATEDRR